MPTPTEPGDYRWHATGHAAIHMLPATFPSLTRARVILTVLEYDGELVAWLPGAIGYQPVARLTTLGEWGERVPDSDTLKAMRELAAEEWTAEDDYGRTDCAFCGAEQQSELVREYPHPLHRGTAREFRYWIDHAPDCPWLRAQESVAPPLCAFDACEETAEGSSLAIIITDVPQAMWDAMSEAEREKCRRFTREVCGEEKPDAPTPRP